MLVTGADVGNPELEVILLEPREETRRDLSEEKRPRPLGQKCLEKVAQAGIEATMIATLLSTMLKHALSLNAHSRISSRHT